MADTQWADISEFQPIVDNEYTLPLITIRSNDGSYEDQHFEANFAWCSNAVSSGKLAMFMVYYFYRPTGQGFDVLKSRVGTPHPKMVVMIDVESAGGAISGNQSAEINREFEAAAQWLGDPRRVIGYGNVGDLDSLWPQKPSGIRLIIADYGGNPDYPGKFGHQYTESGSTPPFPTCDLNDSPNMDLPALLEMFGFTGTSTTTPTTTTTEEVTMFVAVATSADEHVGNGTAWVVREGGISPIATPADGTALEAKLGPAVHLTGPQLVALSS